MQTCAHACHTRRPTAQTRVRTTHADVRMRVRARAPASEIACTPCAPTRAQAHLRKRERNVTGHTHTRVRAQVHTPYSFTRSCNARAHRRPHTRPMDGHTGTPANMHTRAQADGNTDQTTHASAHAYLRTPPPTGAHMHGCAHAQVRESYTTPAYGDAHGPVHVMHTPTCSHTHARARKVSPALRTLEPKKLS